MNPQPENAKTERSFDDVLADCDWTAHPETLLSNANVLSVNTQKPAAEIVQKSRGRR